MLTRRRGERGELHERDTSPHNEPGSLWEQPLGTPQMYTEVVPNEYVRACGARGHPPHQQFSASPRSPRELQFSALSGL
jgi:hypothetical protein